MNPPVKLHLPFRARRLLIFKYTLRVVSLACFINIVYSMESRTAVARVWRGVGIRDNAECIQVQFQRTRTSI